MVINNQWSVVFDFGPLVFELVDSGPEVDDELGHLFALHLVPVEIFDRFEEEGSLFQLLLHDADLISGLHVEGQEVGSRFVFGVLLGKQDALVHQLALLLKVVVIVSQYA